MHGIPAELLELEASRQAIYTTLTEGIDPDDDEARLALEGMYQNATVATQEELASWLDDMGIIEDACQTDIEALKAFIRRFSDRVIRKERALETLRRHVHEAMSLFDVKSMRTAHSGTWTRVMRPSTDVYSEVDLPSPEEDPALWRVKTELNKTELNARLKAGIQVPGAQLVSTEHLQRKG